jgi:hypothetical protein
MEILVQLVDSGPSSGFTLWRHRVLRVNEMSRTNPESDIPVPPQLNKVAKSVDRIATITP